MNLASVSNIVRRMRSTDELEGRIKAMLTSSDLSLFHEIHEEVTGSNLQSRSTHCSYFVSCQSCATFRIKVIR